MDFSNKSIVITGSGAGVGKFAAKEMANRGGLLTISDIDLNRAEETANEIVRLGGNAIAVETDVTIYNDTKELIATATEAYGQVDILVNNVGTGTIQPFVETNPESWAFEIDICLYSVMNGCHCVLPQMIERGSGKIVNICSDAGRVGEQKMAIYSAAKSGVIGFTKAIAKETAAYDIKINCVCFGIIKTEMVNTLLNAMPGQEEKMAGRYPMKRLGNMKEAAAAIMMMSSEHTSFITGQVLSANGGYAMVD